MHIVMHTMTQSSVKTGSALTSVSSTTQLMPLCYCVSANSGHYEHLLWYVNVGYFLLWMMTYVVTLFNCWRLIYRNSRLSIWHTKGGYSASTNSWGTRSNQAPMSETTRLHWWQLGSWRRLRGRPRQCWVAQIVIITGFSLHDDWSAATDQ